MKYKFIAIFLLGIIFSISIPAFAATNSPCPTKKVKTITGKEEDKLNGIEVEVNIPLVTTPCKFEGEDIYYVKDLNTFAAAMYKFLIGLAGIAAVIAMMVGGYMWLFSGGNASKVGEAKSIIGSAVFGLFLTIGSFMILNLINPDLVNWRFNPNIEAPTLANFANVKRICTAGERFKAVGELYKNKDKTMINPMNDFRCGSVYYPKHWEYEVACSKGKEETPECLKAKSEAFQSGCMDVSCPTGGSADYICSIQADSKGSLASGACVNKISATRKDTKESATLGISKSFGSCGQASYGLAVFDAVSSRCSIEEEAIDTDIKFTTCSIISDSSLVLKPDVGGWSDIIDITSYGEKYGKIEGNYKGQIMFMECRSGQPTEEGGAGGKF